MTRPPAGTYWIDPGKFLAGPFPGSIDPTEAEQRIAALVAAGIDRFINLMEPDESNRAGEPFADCLEGVPWSNGAVTMDRFPIRDLSIPTNEEMTATLDAIDHHLADGRAIYLHCWGGVGRTGTVVGCWLLRHGRANPDNVIEVIAELRKSDAVRGHRPSPETKQQRTFVRAWAEGS